MKTDRQFYEAILKKHKRSRTERRRRRQAAVGLSMISAGVLCVVVVAISLLPGAFIGPPTAHTTTTGSIALHGGTSDIHKFPGVIGIGGADPFRNNPFGDSLSISSSFSNLAKAAYDEWVTTFTHAGGTRHKYEHNLYNLIHELNIPRTEVERVCAEHRARFEYDLLTPEQIEVLYTYSKDQAYRYFALDTTVVVGNSFYAIGWLAEHTAAEYVEAGMTATQVETAYQAISEPLIPSEMEHIQRQLALMKGEDPNATTASTTTAPNTQPHLTQTTTAP